LAGADAPIGAARRLHRCVAELPRSRGSVATEPAASGTGFLR
jgi:hypothetical protein